MAAAKVAAADKGSADSPDVLAVAIARVALAAHWQTLGMKSYSGDIL